MATAMTVVTSPGVTLQPVNKEIWYAFSSENSNLNNFKYVLEVSSKKEPFATTSLANIGKYKIPAAPVTGYGLFSPHRVLKTSFSSYVPTSILNSPSIYKPIPGQFIQYNIKYGYEYNPGTKFTSTFNSSGLLGLTFPSGHGFITGDIITIDKDNKQINPGYDGTASVTFLSSNTIRVSKQYGVSSTNESGTITNILRYYGTTSTGLTFNGTKQYTQTDVNDFGIYICDYNLPKSFLSNYGTKSKRVALTDYETLSFIVASGRENNLRIRYSFYKNNSTFPIAQTNVFVSGNTYRRLDIAAGPKSLLWYVDVYTGLSYVNDCDYYTIQLRTQVGSNNLPISELKTYVIDKTCSQYERTTVAFLNRLGGYDFFSFNMDKKKTMTIKRDEYNKILPYNYTIGMRGSTVYNTDVEETFTMNSNWISEYECVWLEELLTSPDATIKLNVS